MHARQARHSCQADARRSCRSSIFITAAAADQPTGSGTTQQAQSKAPVLNDATAGEQQIDVGTVQQAQSDAPVLIGAGGGIFFFWQLGGTQYLNAHYGEPTGVFWRPDIIEPFQPSLSGADLSRADLMDGDRFQVEAAADVPGGALLPS